MRTKVMQDYKGVLVDLRGRRDAFEYVFAGRRRRFPTATRLHATPRRVLAAQAIDRACRAYHRGGQVPRHRGPGGVRLEVWPEAAQQSEWRALERRRRVGPEKAPRMPTLMAHALVRRAVEDAKRFRWQHTGQVK